MNNQLLDYIFKAEGKELHRNNGEDDITTAGGIYRKAHPRAAIFDYIDEIAAKVGIAPPSSEWSHSEIMAVDNALDQTKVDRLVFDFYQNYNRNARLELFPDLCQVAMFSLFTNSQRHAWKAVQSAINKFNSNGWINYPTLKTDGSFGHNTQNGLAIIYEMSKDNSGYAYVFESYMLLEMSQIYGKLAAKNPSKYLKYLNGWNNRLEALAES